MKMLAFGTALFLMFSASQSLAYNDEGIGRFCRQKWPSSYSMEDACRRNQVEGYRNIQGYRKKYGKRPEFINPVIDRCRQKWATSLGADYMMVDACIRNELEAARNLGYEAQAFQSSPNVKTVPDSLKGTAEAVPPAPAPIAVGQANIPKLTFVDFLVDWKSYVGRPVIIVDGVINFAKPDGMLVSGQGGSFYVKPPWLDKEDLRYLMRNCPGLTGGAACTMPVGGKVRAATYADKPEIYEAAFAR